MKLKPSLKQLAARRKFVAMVRKKAKAKKRDQLGSVGAVAKKTTKKKTGQYHKDTKSHNVNIRVVSGLDKVTRKGRKTAVHYTRMSGIEKTISSLMREYIAIYETKNFIVSEAHFRASSLQEAKRFARFHKTSTHEIKKHKNVSVRVKLYRNN